MAAAARFGRCVPVVTRLAVLRRPDDDTAMGRSHVVTRPAFDRAVLRVTKRPLLPLRRRRNDDRSRRAAAAMQHQRCTLPLGLA
jgi:hypothetical protein